jgi:glycosyltransferase involved in cell wall biosynthesis
MKALLVSNIYPSASQPTRGVFNANVFRAIGAYCDVRVVSPRAWWTRLRNPQQLLSAPIEIRDGITASYPSFWSVPGRPKLHGAALAKALLRHAEAIRRSFPFDIVLASWVYPDGFAAARVASRFCCPLVINVLGSDINSLANLPALRPQIIEALSAADRVLTVSKALKERVVELGIPETKVVVQHNGVDGERFAVCDRREARKRLGLPEACQLICTVGRLSQEKGLDVLIAASAKLACKMKDLRVAIVGGGPLEGALKRLSSTLGLANQIVFAGARPNDEVPLWLSACDVFCLPSRSEGCPNVILEALASGRPVVASQVGGIPELLNTANGIMCPPDDPDALALALEHALLDQAWDAVQLRESVEYLSWRDVGAAYHRELVKALERAADNREDGSPAEGAMF